jgi:hypothetical protein
MIPYETLNSSLEDKLSKVSSTTYFISSQPKKLTRYQSFSLVYRVAQEDLTDTRNT